MFWNTGVFTNNRTFCRCHPWPDYADYCPFASAAGLWLSLAALPTPTVVLAIDVTFEIKVAFLQS